MLPPASIAAGYEMIGSKLRLLFFRLQPFLESPKARQNIGSVCQSDRPPDWAAAEH
jgi:hypothetical protein